MRETDTAELPRAGRLDRRRDLAWWLLTPLVTIVVAPVSAGVLGLVALLGDQSDQPPPLCAADLADNGCEETTLGVLGWHVLLFAAVWLSLWLVPWWRGLRRLRVVLAVIAAALLVLAPMWMMS
ncbi:hypothetical protein [Dactylosporangium sp. CA-233914]|uniref:hypothetical protein n=1 Tax=Dactylosporangium sp. CA-233914 TaxID=3239934 RepID=UPI003D8E001B